MREKKLARFHDRQKSPHKRDSKGEPFDLLGARWRFTRDLGLAEVPVRIGRLRALWGEQETFCQTAVLLNLEAASQLDRFGLDDAVAFVNAGSTQNRAAEAEPGNESSQGPSARPSWLQRTIETKGIVKAAREGTIEVPDEASRILSRNLCTLLTPLLDPDFYSLSFGFRPQRGVTHCLAVAEALHQRGLRYLVCCDIRDAFGTVPKKRLLQVLRSRLHQSSVVGLMEELLDRKRDRGIPQGLSLSPLCLNVYLEPIRKLVFAERPIIATL